MSKFHAIDSLDDALEKTKDLLFRPFRLSFWIKLAIVVFIAGSVFESFNFGYDIEDTKKLPDIDISQYMLIIIAVVIALIFIVLIMQFLSAVFNFVFIESVLEKKVEILDGFKRSIGKGIGLFIFNLGLLMTLIIIIALGVFVAFLIYKMNISAIIFIVIIIFGILAFVGVILIFSLMELLTMDFVSVIMYLKKKGIIDSWFYLKDLIKSNLSQFIVYVIVKFLLGIASSIAILIVSFIVYLPIIILVVFFGFVMNVTSLDMLSTLPPILLALILIVGSIMFMGLGYLVTLLTLPISVFFRYYGIIFLNRLDPSLGVLKPGDKAVEQETKRNLSIY